ncbi:MAG TPA: phosphatase PAP2 family protein [Gemmatimonadaceae bacterium]|nr:phosphatase PAP2 family protein [Gemmatimonadaceae bacterium]
MKRPWIQAVTACCLAARLSHAQAPDSATQKTFFVGRDGAIAAGFLAASAAMSIFDVRIAHYFEDTTHLHVREGQKLDKIFTHINETTLTVGGLAVYGIGKLTHQETVADVAFHVAESVAAASLTAQVVRGPLGRTRPRNTAQREGDQYDFHFFKGFTNFKYRAFPSIHSSSGFAAASAIVAEVKRRDPKALWPVAIPAYALALTPGLSRMYLGQHWASDIFSGAFLGTFYGWRIVNYSHSHPTTRIDRIFLGSVDHAHLGLEPHGFSFSWGTRF